MRTSRAVRTAGVGRKSYLSSGTASAMPRTRLRVLSHVALVGVRKLVAGNFDGAPGAEALGVCAIPGVVQSTASMATTTRPANAFLLMSPPLGRRDSGDNEPVPRAAARALLLVNNTDALGDSAVSPLALAESVRYRLARSPTGPHMQIRFWGTRGALAKPGPGTLHYGGNTSCVEVRTGSGTLIVFDCGTGAHGLGQALMASGAPIRGHLMITHTHWDHIQGFPFFAPLFGRGHEWDIYAPGGLGQQLEQTLAGQMEYTYFPVTLAQLGATIRYHDLVEGSFSVEDVRVVAKYLNHPALALGYRLEVGGVIVVYASDHEPHTPWASEGAGGKSLAHREDLRHVEFLRGADLVIHDAQYDLGEYREKIGWGHTPAECAVDYALAAGVRRLAVYHHDPMRDDAGVDSLIESCRQRVAASGGQLEVFAAAEGQVVDLVEGAGAAAPAARSTTAPSRATGETILVADDDPSIVMLLRASLESDGFRVVTADDGMAALDLARAERPALLLLDWQMPRASGVEVTRALRGDADPELAATPVVLITAQSGSENTAAGFAAGVTDYLTKPFRPAHVRARVRAWLLRRNAGAAGA